MPRQSRARTYPYPTSSYVPVLITSLTNLEEESGTLSLCVEPYALEVNGIGDSSVCCLSSSSIPFDYSRLMLADCDLVKFQCSLGIMQATIREYAWAYGGSIYKRPSSSPLRSFLSGPSVWP
jgi:hypothetical protein